MPCTSSLISRSLKPALCATPMNASLRTVQSATHFDLHAFKRAYEAWDIEALLDLYADDVELVQIDGDNPPSAPRVRHGKEVFRGMFEHCAGAGVEVTVENAVTGPDRAAATITCRFPGGRAVLANSILELEDGRIVREREVLAGDPKTS
jgi:ketosteroid isomerase-like protein